MTTLVASPLSKALSIVLFIPLGAINAGCGAADAARPREPTYAEIAGASTASFLDRNASPYILEWEPSQHAALDAAMQKGVVVVAYNGASVALLPDCHLGGAYQASGVTPQSGKVKLKNTDTAAAGSPQLPASQEVRAGFDRGASVNFEYVIAGRREASRVDARRGELEGLREACRGATHFIHSAFVGAFRRLSDTSADIHVGARVLGAEAKAGSSSAKSTEAQAGDMDACRKGQTGAGGAGSASNGCFVPIQIELRPLASSTLVHLTFVSFTIEPNDPSGSAWDRPGRTPDPIFALSNGLGFDFKTPVMDDTLTGAPSLSIGPFEMTEEGPLVLLALDDDEPLGKEMIGSTQVSLTELRGSPYIDKEIKLGGKVTGRVRLQARVEVLSVPVP